MGTLTADMPRLAEHCPHKLATSCRLTSTPNCCACADERPHSTSYRVYIDGVGFVQRGTRWQSYCWFCKEFWNNRIASTDPPLELSQTRIPRFPDQSEFLERWNEFHQGYRVVKAADGTESRIAVVGEPFRDVSPGYLPRTLNELRTGQQNDATRVMNRTTRVTSAETTSATEPHHTIEDELDRLLENEEEPDPLSVQQQRSLEIQQQLRERRAERRAERAAERLRRVWGTREDIESDEYMSPITGLFVRTREWHRRQQERLRNEAGQQPVPATQNVDLDEGPFTGGFMRTREWRRRLHEQLRDEEDQQTVPATQDTAASPSSSSSNVAPREALEPQGAYEPRQQDLDWLRRARDQLRQERERMSETDRRLERVAEDIRALERTHNQLTQIRGMEETQRRLAEAQQPAKHLDNDGRPEPKTDVEKMVKLECQICYQQIASMACIPCGHLVMCEWCADIQMPVKHHNVPEIPSKCPMCRKKVSHRVKIHIG